MPRRKKTQTKKRVAKKETKPGFLQRDIKFASGGHHEARFKFSLVFLIAGLLLSVFILLLVLINVQNEGMNRKAVAAPVNVAAMKSAISQKLVLQDADLPFTLKIPAQLGDWFYKKGYVKSPVDESLSNRYVNIFVPQGKFSKSNNLDDMAKSILTIREFSAEEWEKLDEGCAKGNQIFCEDAGTKLGEKNNMVWTYTKIKDCPKAMEAKCSLADKISQSFN